MADQLAKLGSKHLFTGPEPAWGISMEDARKAVGQSETTGNAAIPYLDSKRQRHSYKDFLPRRQAVKHEQRPAKWVVGLLTGHCHLKGQLFKLSLVNSPRCKRCLEREKISHTHSM
jgi:hypothetical protein